MKKLYLILILGMFLISFANAEVIGTFKQGQEMQITNYCSTADCTSAKLSSIKYPNGTILSINDAMTKNGNEFNYTYTPSELGEYYFTTCSNPNGVDVCEMDSFEVTSTGGDGSSFFIILISSLAVIFFIASLFVPEEFFVYISGVLFLLGGVYLMMNGLDVLNDYATRGISFVYIGIGLLFSIGAYIYNLYTDNSQSEEY